MPPRPSTPAAATADIIATNPEMVEYCKARGPRKGVLGSLLCVRDFIVRNCGYDIGVDGVNVIRESVRSCIGRIANKSKEDLTRVYSNVESSMVNTELNGTSNDMWKYLLKTNVTPKAATNFWH